jgi:hypothetical protein
MSSLAARRFVGALASVAALTSCTSGASTAAWPVLGLPQMLARASGSAAAYVDSELKPHAHLYGNDWMYSTEPAGSKVVVYARQLKGFKLAYFRTLKSGIVAPMGTVTTPDGLWYVANSGKSNILVYQTTPSGPRGPVATLLDGEEVPVNVAATLNRKLVVVSNVSTTGSGGGSMSVYSNQRRKPLHVLSYGADALQGEGVAISKGNCYWSFNDPKNSAGSIVEFAGCKGNGTLVQSGILKAGGIAFDQKGNLYYVDQSTGIYKCNGTSQCVLFAVGFGVPVNINFDPGYKNLWVADAAGYIDAVNASSGVIEYTREAIGGSTDPPFGIAPSSGN